MKRPRTPYSFSLKELNEAINDNDKTAMYGDFLDAIRRHLELDRLPDKGTWDDYIIGSDEAAYWIKAYAKMETNPGMPIQDIYDSLQ